MKIFNDVVGQRFSRWMAMREDSRKGRRRYIICRCDCGKEISVLLYSLTSGASQSCGCLQKETAKITGRTHGNSTHPLYSTWASMHYRCSDPGYVDYPKYGARGISVCSEWFEFSNFISDMGERPTGMTLDRRDNDAGYSPDNCRWATAEQQNRNRRICKMISAFGETLTLADWVERTGIGRGTIRTRLRNGWDIERALSERIDQSRKTA